jgi:hypothetical protein
MRTILAIALFVLVPSAALADDEAVTTVIHEHVEKPKPKTGYIAPELVAFEGGALPKDASLTRRPTWALVGAGLGVFGATYTASVIAAAVSCPPQGDCPATRSAAWLYLPIVGPFITAAQSTSTGGAALAAFDGTLQVTGAALAIAGLIAQKKFVMWQEKSTTLTVMPTATNAGAGFALTLTHL